QKYCSFMPYPIYLEKANAPEEFETINPEDKKDDDVVVETVEEDKPGKEEGSTEKVTKLKIKKRPVALNDTHPLWTKHPNECTKEEYVDFYRKVFKDYKEPLFWIH
ncbi:MAG TPA: molecular chaperone HtpG, partial [Lachnospiraceae bacterium]|nr:molecular chaperone HtpG [Lachnospiraceae bacterium]